MNVFERKWTYFRKIITKKRNVTTYVFFNVSYVRYTYQTKTEFQSHLHQYQSALKIAYQKKCFCLLKFNKTLDIIY